ncbi:MAG TPA: DUF6600 domain-containing protein [Stellaceae bacterium]
MDFKTGVLAAIFIASGATSPYADQTPQVKLATAEPRAAATAANPIPSPPPHAGGIGTSGAVAGAAATLTAPSARVGRISLVSGNVEFRGLGDAQWSAASVNDPVATGLALRTGSQAQAEIRIGADTIDLAQDTEIAVAKLDQPIAEIAVSEGRIGLDIGRLDRGESVLIDLAHGGVWVLDRGRYDIVAGAEEHPERIAALAGNARFVGGGADLPIASGYQLLPGSAETATARIETAGPPDDFDQWCGARTVDDSQLAAPYFVSREMTGYAALDEAGDWQPGGKDGEVWVPRASAAEWSPYRNGHWRWLAPWGWSWVDDQPWAFATSHYGRWRFADGRWLWTLGRRSAHPVWAPAVVAFLGTPGIGLSYADGPGPAIAWFPLAPGEVYWPGYTRDLDYIRALNRGSDVDLSAIRLGADREPPAEIADAHFANRSFASVVPRPIFVAGQPIADALLTIPDERLRDAPAIMGSPRIGSPPLVAATAPRREHQPSLPAGVAGRSTKTAAWARMVRAAAIRSHNYQEVARLRFLRLRVSASVEMSRLRRSIVLRVARFDHALLHSEAHRRMIRR